MSRIRSKIESQTLRSRLYIHVYIPPDFHRFRIKSLVQFPHTAKLTEALVPYRIDRVLILYCSFDTRTTAAGDIGGRNDQESVPSERSDDGRDCG